MASVQWLILFVVLTAAYVAGQGISILLFRPRMRRAAVEAPADGLRPPRTATWHSGTRASRKQEEE
uniref:Uncharacterized protein n=1 Tax=viral metagenome TaxID=1070528 RepID=A0A6M3IES4_9ZZZZ